VKDVKVEDDMVITINKKTLVDEKSDRDNSSPGYNPNKQGRSRKERALRG